MENERIITPIAHIRTDFPEKFGIPRQSGRAPSLKGKIIFEPEYRVRESLREIETFSHLWLIFDFSEAHTDKWSPTVRPPRLGGNRRVGVFASRSPFRPNSLGLSSVKLEKIENTSEYGDVLIVSGVDLLDNTPIYDIKPYIPYSDSHNDAVGGYADNERFHKLNVKYSDQALIKIVPELRKGLTECLSDDPRPSYQNDPEREYCVRYASYDVHFKINGDELNVTSVEII